MAAKTDDRDEAQKTLDEIRSTASEYASSEQSYHGLSHAIDWGIPIAGIVSAAVTLFGDDYRWVAAVLGAIAAGLSAANSAKRPRERVKEMRISKEAFEALAREFRDELGRIKDRWKGGHQSEEESNRMEANMKMVKRFNDLIKTETERTSSR